MTLVRILLAFDALVALVIVGFFVVGLSDGSVSSFNGGLWFGILAALTVVLVGGWQLGKNGRRGAAIKLLLALAIPALCFVAFFAVVLIAQPRWN